VGGKTFDRKVKERLLHRGTHSPTGGGGKHLRHKEGKRRLVEREPPSGRKDPLGEGGKRPDGKENPLEKSPPISEKRYIETG